MQKNRLFLMSFLILITCTGCKVEYNINITENNVEESINVTDYTTSKRTKKEILNHYNMWYPTYVNFITDGESIEIEDFSEKIEGIEYHEKKINQISNGYKYNYQYTYPVNKYYDSYILASSFAETTVYKRTNSIVLKTGKENFLCDYDYFEEAKINITIDPNIYKLNYTNAEKHNNNTFTWVLDKNNCNNSEIILTLDIVNNNIGNNSSNKNTLKNKAIDEYMYYIFFGVLAIIIYLGYKWFQNLKGQNNDIE